MVTADNDNISKQDLDLTEQELNKIFFAPGEIKVFPSTVKKVSKHKKEISKPDIIPPNIEETIDDLPPDVNDIPDIDSDKKQVGRPKFWTEERIKEFQELRKKEIQEKKKNQEEIADFARQSYSQPMTDYERKKIIAKKIKKRHEVESELVKRREDNQKLLTQNTITQLWNKSKCKGHMYRMLYFSGDQVSVTCKHCSASSMMSIAEWRKYLAKNGRLI